MTAKASGPALVQVRAPDGATFRPMPDLEIPDSDTVDLDVDIGGAALSGTVADRTTGRPLETARVCAYVATPSGPRRDNARLEGGCADTNTEGAFRIESRPGEYRVTAQLGGYTMDEVAVSVPDSGLDGV